jgi:hypothetical protein
METIVGRRPEICSFRPACIDSRKHCIEIRNLRFQRVTSRCRRLDKSTFRGQPENIRSARRVANSGESEQSSPSDSGSRSLRLVVDLYQMLKFNWNIRLLLSRWRASPRHKRVARPLRNHAFYVIRDNAISKLRETVRDRFLAFLCGVMMVVPMIGVEFHQFFMVLGNRLVMCGNLAVMELRERMVRLGNSTMFFAGSLMEFVRFAVVFR